MDSLGELHDLWKNKSILDDRLGTLQSERIGKEKRIHDRLASVLWDAGLDHVVISPIDEKGLNPIYHIWIDEGKIRILKSGDYPPGNKTTFSFSESLTRYPELFKADIFKKLIDICLKERKEQNEELIKCIEAERARITRAEGLKLELDEVGL